MAQVPIIPAKNYSSYVQETLYHPLEYILASEVIREFMFRCANGMQYTTFPNRITPEEKQKLESAGYFVTENTVESQYRYGAPDLYIGFQVALSSYAIAKAMQIGQVVPSPDSGYQLFDADGNSLLDATGDTLYAGG